MGVWSQSSGLVCMTEGCGHDRKVWSGMYDRKVWSQSSGLVCMT